MPPKKRKERRGRKPEEDPKKMVPVWLRESDIKLLGGKEKAQDFLTEVAKTKLDEIRNNELLKKLENE